MKKQIFVLLIVVLSTLFIYWCTQSTKYDNSNHPMPDQIQQDTENNPSQDDILAPTETLDTTSSDISADRQIVYTMIDISSHDDAISCWTVIDNNVYDLTSWIPQHPGWESQILQLCGTDWTTIFQSQHGWQSLQEDTLTDFKIGIISQ